MNDVLDLVREAAAQVLEMSPDDVDPDAGFFDLGMDSAMATGFVVRLESAVGRSLSTTVLFDHPTARGLAAYLSTVVDPVDSQPADSQPADSQPADSQPAEGDEADEGLLQKLRRETTAARTMREGAS